MAKKKSGWVPSETGRLLMAESVKEITAYDQMCYAAGLMGGPELLPPEMTKGFTEAVLKFANVGWTTFHNLNNRGDREHCVVSIKELEQLRALRDACRAIRTATPQRVYNKVYALLKEMRL